MTSSSSILHLSNKDGIWPPIWLLFNLYHNLLETQKGGYNLGGAFLMIATFHELGYENTHTKIEVEVWNQGGQYTQAERLSRGPGNHGCEP